jgi:elongator complex protein 3
MTVETRPDSFDQAMAEHVMSLGATRMEFGVQILDEAILRAVGRGHGVEEVVQATQVAKGHGLKVCYHVMPGLPGSSPELDLERFALMFQDERFMPDMLKIYPTLVVKGTPLYDMWCRGEYEPYSTERAAHVVAEMKRLVPRWARIQRIQRDIPVQLIEAGVDKSHLRELARDELRSRGISCQCIRCREVGLKGIRRFEREEVHFTDVKYHASQAVERFLSFDLPESDSLVAYLRLRLGPGHRAQVRELKVFGQMARIGQEGREAQHRGFGRGLIAHAEALAKEEGYAEMAVTSGVGVRPYYATLGYSRHGPYMVKPL